MQTTTYFTINVCGHAKCGKSSFLLRHATGHFYNEIPSSMLYESYVLKFKTNKGDYVIKCNERDTDKNCDAKIILFDISEPFRTQKVHTLKKINESKVPIVVCGNKCDKTTKRTFVQNFEGADEEDLKDRNVNIYEEFTIPESIMEAIKGKSVEVFLISAQSNYDFEKPFRSLLRKLTGHEDLNFIP